MRIEVIGYKGVVGAATYELFKRLGYEVSGSDEGDKINKADIYFVCVPEDLVEEPLNWLDANRIKKFKPIKDKDNVVEETGEYEGLVVIRSSVPPTTCRMLSRRHSMHICHNPEFLREATAVQDELNPARIVIGGCCKEHGDLIESLYKPLQRPIIRTDPTTSELTKLASNAYLSTVISYWNTIEELAKRVGASGHQIGMIASLDPRISEYGSRMHNKYGGRCLPKDIKQLIRFAESYGYDPVLLKAVEEVNNNL